MILLFIKFMKGSYKNQERLQWIVDKSKISNNSFEGDEFREEKHI